MNPGKGEGRWKNEAATQFRTLSRVHQETMGLVTCIRILRISKFLFEPT